MPARRFRPSALRPRKPFGRLRRAVAPPLPRGLRTPRRLLRKIAFGVGIFVVLLGLAAGEGGGWLGRNEAIRAPTARDTTAKAAAARSIPLCPSKFRGGGGGVTCITDGDSGVVDGEPWRLTTRSGGVDAPEVGRPECAAERAAAGRATRRLQALMSSGYTMSGGNTDRYGRRLVVVTLADGRDAGRVLIDEGLAQPWPNSSNPWC